MISSLLTMIPFYLFANLHCLGMCGPLAIMISQHKMSNYYLFGRIMGFTLGACLATSLGALFSLNVGLSAFLCFIMGMVMVLFGLSPWIPHKAIKLSFLDPINDKLTLLLLKEKKWPTTLFGFMTIFLPCGQSLVLFSFCALLGNPLLGAFHGLVFSLLTTPALAFALQAKKLLQKFSAHGHRILGSLSVTIGLLTWCRGLADLEVIPHLALDLGSSAPVHLVMW